MGAEPAVTLGSVSVRFPRGTQPVLSDVSLALAPGEQVLVLGPSGSGKSTLLQTITGVLPHSVVADVSGSVVVCGRDLSETPVVELSRFVGVLAQDPSSGLCLPDVEQELALPLENRAVDPGLISERIDGALATVGATALRTRKTAELSGGEGQRIALAATLVAEPAVLLLDEPTAMLDGEGIAAVRGAIVDAVDAYGPAVVLVEHRIDEFAGDRGLAGLPARTVVLGADGRILADGPTATVLDRTATTLQAAGCWLPLETELRAVFGVTGGLGSENVRRGLVGLAAPGSSEASEDTEATEESPRPGDVVLSASGLAVSRNAVGAKSGRHFRRSGAGRAVAVPAILSGVNLEVRAGETVALLGANGVGKSSLLLTLAGLLPAAAGEVRGPRPGIIFQNPEHQFLAATVRGEIGHGLPAGSDTVIDGLLATSHLVNREGQSPFRLSGGEKRRLSVAAMLAHDRPSLLADEPTFGLDRRSTIATIAGLRAAAANGRAIVFASHDIRTVATLATRILIVADGVLIADGPVYEVLRNRTALARAGIAVPPLVRWLLDAEGPTEGVRRVLDALDALVPPDFTAARRMVATGMAERP